MSADSAAMALTRIASGDQQAFEQLYRTTSAILLGVCLRVLNDRAEAEDVLQEVYVNVWRKAVDFDPRRSPALAWLAAIARNRSIDRLRRSPGKASRVSIDLAEPLHDPAPTPASYAESAGERARLDDCMQQLEPQRQLLIRTAFFDGATYEELATRSGSPLGTVKSWIRRGLMQLKACLEQ